MITLTVKAYLKENDTSYMMSVRGYTDSDRDMLMVILRKSDYNHLVRGVHQVDPGFRSCLRHSEAHGGTFI